MAAMAGAGMRSPDVNGQGPAGLLKADFSPAPGAPQSFADIFAKVSPAVVSINVTSKAEALQPAGQNRSWFQLSL